MPANRYGSFTDRITIDNGAKLGQYRVIARPNKPDPTLTLPPIPVEEARRIQQPKDPQFVTEITVREYTPPEYRVGLKPEKEYIAPGGKICVEVDASYQRNLCGDNQ